MTRPGADRGRYPELAGQVAVITGAAKGIGRGIATRLIAEGMSVVAADIDGETLATTVESFRAAGGTALAVTGDLSLVADVDRLFEETVERFATVDLLVNNAADLRRRRLLDEHTDVLDLQLATNIRSPYLCSQRAASIMRDHGGGSIVHNETAKRPRGPGCRKGTYSHEPARQGLRRAEAGLDARRPRIL